MDDSTARVLLVRVGLVLGGFDASAVREILPPPPATRLPGAAAPVLGIANIRGALVTIVDARRLLGQDPRPVEESLVLVSVEGRTAGLVVDDVVDLVVPAAAESEDRAVPPGMNPAVIRARGHSGRGPYLLFDLAPLLETVLSSQGAQ